MGRSEIVPVRETSLRRSEAWHWGKDGSVLSWSAPCIKSAYGYTVNRVAG